MGCYLWQNMNPLWVTKLLDPLNYFQYCITFSDNSLKIGQYKILLQMDTFGLLDLNLIDVFRNRFSIWE